MRIVTQQQIKPTPIALAALDLRDRLNALHRGSITALAVLGPNGTRSVEYGLFRATAREELRRAVSIGLMTESAAEHMLADRFPAP